MKIYNVIFKEPSKPIKCEAKLEVSNNEFIVAETSFGLQYGRVINCYEGNLVENENVIIRKATEEDKLSYEENLKLASKAFKKCCELVNELGLKMNVISSQYTLDKNKLLFNFTADERIDFRELAKNLANIYHTRIELRQIGARDKAKDIGGVGICGQKLCCANFLNKMDGISMNMAKNQNLALNPSKINGVCGRLLCCLSYEDELYQECQKGMPQIGKKYHTPEGDAIIESIDILNRSYKVTIDGEKKEFNIDEDSKK